MASKTLSTCNKAFYSTAAAAEFLNRIEPLLTINGWCFFLERSSLVRNKVRYEKPEDR